MAALERCINLDWLEVYCEEYYKEFPCNADYFTERGYSVSIRDYGTRQYREMFIVNDFHGDPFVEVRRNPVSGDAAKRVRGIFSEYSCHIRLVNRYCYAEHAVENFLEFLNRHKYHIVRIFRLDLALDFEKFDDGTDPQKFLERYLAGKFTKVNQGSISAHGVDRWEGRHWQSLSWGAPKSMVSTKLYNKTAELSQVKDKPYIRYAWFCSGLVDDYVELLKRGKDGVLYKPAIWRLEFSIRSSAKGWVVIEDNSGKRSRTMAVEHTLDQYCTRQQLFDAWGNLCKHYFHFKYYEEGKRKDLCRDRVLFHLSDNYTYTLDKLLSHVPKNSAVANLRVRLEQYRASHYDTAVQKACDVLIKALSRDDIVKSLQVYDADETKLLQLLISRRLYNKSVESFSESLAVVREMMALDGKLI